MDEIWKDIYYYNLLTQKWVDYRGLYQVSNYGRLRSLDRYVVRGWRWKTIMSKRIYKGKILNPKANKYGYNKVTLSKEGKQETPTVHVIVANMFLPNPYGYTQINHKDENKLNNFVYINEDGTVDLEKSNIEWCSAKYNCNFGTRNKRISQSQKGKKRSCKT